MLQYVSVYHALMECECFKGHFTAIQSQKHIYDLLAGDLKLMLEIAMKANQRLLVVCSARPLNAHQAGNSWLSLARW